MSTAIASSSSSNSALNSKNHDVFLSFRGEDTRKIFTCHLNEALRQKNIKTYMDEDNLKRGEEISSALKKAIEETKLSVIIFSENYASSSWCLDELLHILLCKEKYGQEVVPVFYGVDPSCVRKQEGSYKEAFDNHEERFKDKMEKVHKWRKALEKAANLSGFPPENSRLDSDLVEEIVEDILRKLRRITPYDYSKDFVGIEEPIKEIESMLQIGSSDVRIIGLWGIGGIGKTTLARVIFNRLSRQFDGFCFLSNVTEKWEKGKKEYGLQSKLFSKLLGEYKSRDNSFPEFDRNRLQGKKVLVVLDDVNNEEQLKYLAGSHDWFGRGSRIIITSRNAELFKNRAHQIYEVAPLSPYDALQLFHLNISKRMNGAITNCSFHLSQKVAEYARGVPLALEVLGSLFGSKSTEQWKSLLDELKSSPIDERIHNVLRSYNDLNDLQKTIFLDIACFFKGYDRGDVEKILKGCDLYVNRRIDDLVDKSLITINGENEIDMHDLIQDMGQEIIRQQWNEEPGNCSRLWIAKDICHVLKNNRASAKVEVIFLNQSHIKAELSLRPTVFQETYRLRLLKIYNSEYSYFKTDSSSNTNCKVHLPQGLQSLPDTLSYLHWDEYPRKSLPSNFDPENLVQLIMRNSQVEQLWNGVQNLSNLIIIDLSYSKKLIQMPDLSLAPNLEQMKFRSCTSLFQVPSCGSQNFEKLTYLDMSYCEKLSSLPDFVFSRSIVHLNLRGCRNIKSLPENKGNNVTVHLDLSETIPKLPTSFVSSHQLETLNLEDCQGLYSLTISQCKSLRNLSVSGCSSLETISELPRSLERINLSKTAISHLPSSIGANSHLDYLILRDCKKFQSLPTDICKLKHLWKLDLYGCSKFENFPEISEQMRVATLDLSKTAIKELPSLFVPSDKLRLSFCENLEFIPGSIYDSMKYGFIDLSSYSGLLKRLPPTDSIELLHRRRRHLDTLILSDHDMLEIPDWPVSRLSWVRKLFLIGKNLDTVPAGSIQKFSNLRYLYIGNWKKLRSLPELPFSLENLDAQGCTSLETVLGSSSSHISQIQGHYLQQSQSFLNCLKLDENSLKNIISDAQRRILGIAVNVLSTRPRISHSRNACICFPGNKIPEWYNYQSTGCSIDIKLTNSECRRQSKFLGFSCCLVAAFKEHNSSKIGLRFCAEVHSKINSGKSFEAKIWFYEKAEGITAWIPYPHDTDEDEQIIINSGKEEPTIVNSDHVLMCYESRSLWNCYEPLKEGFITDISLRFFPVNSSGCQVVDSCEVKSCGVRLLYCQEAKELGFSIPVPKFSKNCDYRLRRHLRPVFYSVTIEDEDEDTKEEEDSDDDFTHVQNLHREGYCIYDIAPVDEYEEDEDFANAHDVIWDSNVEYYGSEAAAINSATEEKEDDEAVANSRDVIGDSKVEEVHDNELLHPATVQEQEKEDNELKSTSSFGCLQFLSHHFRAIFECILGKNSELEPHLDSSATSSGVVASSSSIEFHERLRAKDEKIQNLELQNKQLLQCLQMAKARPPTGSPIPSDSPD